MKKHTEAIWAAGFFDGEGCIDAKRQVDKRKDPPIVRRYFRLQVAQKDRRPLDRFLAAVGTGSIRGPYPSQGDKFFYAAQGKDAEAALDVIRPFLSEPKREQESRVRKRLTDRT